MREKITTIKFQRNNFIFCDDGYIRFTELGIDQILSLLVEEIKKELLTDEEIQQIWLEYPATSRRAIAQAQLDKILKEMEK